MVGTSFNGNTLPPANVVQSSDFMLLHGNGFNDPVRIVDMVKQTRKIETYRPMPILFNEDDHYDFDLPKNNLSAAISVHVSWGFFDFRRSGESYEEGYQSVQVDWGINSERKKEFFMTLQKITESKP